MEGAGLSDPLPLEDGSVHRARPGDRLDALLATIEGSEHELHEPLRRLADHASDDAKELAELIGCIGVGAEFEEVTDEE